MRFTPTQDKQISDLYKSGKTSQQIADGLGVLKQRILNALKRTNTPRRKIWRRASGEKNGKWKGGVKYIKGYKHIKNPAHPLARRDGYIAEHRLLKSSEITNSKQIVHHKNGQITDNSPENLEVMPDNGIHRKLHAKIQPRIKNGRFK